MLNTSAVNEHEIWSSFQSGWRFSEQFFISRYLGFTDIVIQLSGKCRRLLRTKYKGIGQDEVPLLLKAILENNLHPVSKPEKYLWKTAGVQKRDEEERAKPADFP